MVSAAGRGRPRPLLAGVYRKACDYCVRSKRGCNGGTPCEQCVRREQPCTYSQRRKSGPRGRPVRQQLASPASTSGTKSSVPSGSKSSTVTRASTRRRPNTPSTRDTSPTASNSSTVDDVPTARTESISSCSSDLSQSEGWDSDAEMPSVQGNRSDDERTSPEPKATAPQAAATTALKSEPQLPSPSLIDISPPNSRPEPESISESNVAKPSAMIETGRSSQPEVKDTIWSAGSTVTGLPLQRAEDHMTWTQTPSAPPLNDVEEGASNPVLHQISSKPWEISASTSPSPVVGDVGPVFPQVFAHLRGFAGATGSASHLSVASTPTLPSVAVSGPSSSPFGGALLPQGAFSEDLREGGLELSDCPSLRGMKPSLTREVSLARAVEALGNEQSAQSMGAHDISGFVW